MVERDNRSNRSSEKRRLYGIERKELEQRATFEDVAIQTTFGENWAIPSHVREIELGRFQEALDGLARETGLDKKHRESSGLIRIKLRKNKQPFVYLKKYPSIRLRAANYEFSNIITELTFHTRTAAEVHTHPQDVPHSIPQDLKDVLRCENANNYIPFSVVSAVNGLTQQVAGKYFLFRTESTPHSVTNEELNSFLKTLGITSTKKERLQDAFQTIFQPGKVLQSNLGEEEDMIERKVREYILWKIGEKFGLKLFVAKPGENIAQLVDFSEGPPLFSDES